MPKRTFTPITEKWAQTFALEVKVMLLHRFLAEENGQTLVEYGLLLALIAVVVIAAVTVLGRKLANTFNIINATLPS